MIVASSLASSASNPLPRRFSPSSRDSTRGGTDNCGRPQLGSIVTPCPLPFAADAARRSAPTGPLLSRLMRPWSRHAFPRAGAPAAAGPDECSRPEGVAVAAGIGPVLCHEGSPRGSAAKTIAMPEEEASPWEAATAKTRPAREQRDTAAPSRTGGHVASRLRSRAHGCFAWGETKRKGCRPGSLEGG